MCHFPPAYIAAISEAEIVYILPCDRSEEPRVRGDPHLLLELNEGGFGEYSKILGCSVGSKLLCGRTGGLGDEELLELFYVITRDAEIQVAGEDERGRRGRRAIRFCKENGKLGSEGSD